MQAFVRKWLHCSFILWQMHYISCTDMGWSYTRVTFAVFCSAVLRVSPRYNCAVFCITAVHMLCLFCSVTNVLCVFCSAIHTLCVFCYVTPVLCVFCSAIHTLCVFYSVTPVLCVFCSVACPVHLEAWATLVFEPSRNSLLCGLRHSPRLRCCTNVIWTLRWGNAIVCITTICFLPAMRVVCISHSSCWCLHPFRRKPVTTALCFFYPRLLMWYVLRGLWFVICACT